MSFSKSPVIQLSSNSKIKFFPLVTQPAGEGKIYLGSRITESFVKIKRVWEPISIGSGKVETLDDIVRLLGALRPDYFKNKGDSELKVLLLHLIKNNLVEEIDGVQIAEAKVYGDGNKKLPSWYRYIVNKFTIPVFLFFASFSILLPLARNNLAPAIDDFFWTDTFSLCFLTSFVFGWSAGAIHEFAHFLTAGSQGVRGKFNLSHRLNIIVLETRYPNIFSIPKIWRIATFASGIVLDLVVIALTYFVLIIYGKLFPIWLYKLLKQAVLVEWLAVLWEFLFYTNTDIYYVIREAFGVDNLYTASKRKIVRWIKGKEFDITLSARDNKIVNMYTLFFVLGSVVAILRYGFFQIPITYQLILGSITHIIEGAKVMDYAKMLDGAIVIVLEAVGFTLLAITIYKDRKDENLKKLLEENV